MFVLTKTTRCSSRLLLHKSVSPLRDESRAITLTTPFNKNLLNKKVCTQEEEAKTFT